MKRILILACAVLLCACSPIKNNSSTTISSSSQDETTTISSETSSTTSTSSTNIDVSGSILNKMEFKNLTPSSEPRKLEIEINPKDSEYKFVNDNEEVCMVSTDGTVSFLSEGKSIISLVSYGKILDDIHINVWPDEVISTIGELKDAELGMNYNVVAKVIASDDTSTCVLADSSGIIALKDSGFMFSMISVNNTYALNAKLIENKDGQRYLTTIETINFAEEVTVNEKPLYMSGEDLSEIDLSNIHYATIIGNTTVNYKTISLSIENSIYDVELSYFEKENVGLLEDIKNNYVIKVDGVIISKMELQDNRLYMIPTKIEIIEKEATSIKILNKEAFSNVKAGQEPISLEIETNPTNLAYEVISSNPNVISVSNQKTLNFLKTGESLISVKADNISDTLLIKVSEDSSIEFENIDKVKLETDSTIQHTIKGKVVYKNSSDGTVYFADSTSMICINDHDDTLSENNAYTITGNYDSYEEKFSIIKYDLIEENIDVKITMIDENNVETFFGEYVKFACTFVNDLSGWFKIGEGDSAYYFSPNMFNFSWNNYGLSEPALNSLLNMEGTFINGMFGVEFVPFTISL